MPESIIRENRLVEDLVTGPDELARCGWAGTDPVYCVYHDREWGRPLHGDEALFQLLCLEGFQAGLAWITILRKREAFRSAFAGFRLETLAGWGEADVERLFGDAGIVRHRGKIEATLGNARAALALPDGLDALVWSFAPPARERRPATLAEVPALTPESTALSKELRLRGFGFVGPTTVYAFMQSAGLADDHLEGCASAEQRDEPSQSRALGRQVETERKEQQRIGEAEQQRDSERHVQRRAEDGQRDS